MRFILMTTSVWVKSSTAQELRYCRGRGTRDIAIPDMVFSIRKMKTKVLVIHCVAGMPVDRTLHTPLKKVTVYLPEEVNQTTPNPQEKAEQLAHQVLKLEIVNDPQFKGGCYWQTEETEVDLSDYGTPTLESSNG